MDDPQVTINDSASRFEAVVDGTTAFLDFRRRRDHLVLVHTEVPPSLEGRGVGGALVRAALDHARAEGLTVVPNCPFARSYLERHPDEAKTVKIAGADHPQT